MALIFFLLNQTKDRLGLWGVCLTNVCLEDIKAEGEERSVVLRWKSKCGIYSGEKVLP